MLITVESMAYGADAIGRHDGKAVFIAGGVPGDVVEVTVTANGKHFSRAEVTGIVSPSPDRVDPACPYARVCDGCPWSHLSYEAQLEAKQKNVCDTLARIGKLTPDQIAELVDPIIAPGEPWGYRNKIELAAYDGPRGLELGMHASANDEAAVVIDQCLLLPSARQKLPHALDGALRFMSNKYELELERIGIRVSTRTNETEIALWTSAGPFPRNQIANILLDSTQATSVVRVLTKGPRKARTVSGVECLSGLGHWDECVADTVMGISAPSFFQVNTAGAEKLISLVLEGLAPRSDEISADLFCGAGTFTLPLAQATAGVTAIESNGRAVRDLRANVRGKPYEERIDIICDDAERQLGCLNNVDLIVVDPPRAGLDRSIVSALAASPARMIAYVSCDPATLARDLAAFMRLGTMKPVRITPVDLFPQTYHVETVTILQRV